MSELISLRLIITVLASSAGASYGALTRHSFKSLYDKVYIVFGRVFYSFFPFALLFTIAGILVLINAILFLPEPFKLCFCIFLGFPAYAVGNIFAWLARVSVISVQCPNPTCRYICTNWSAFNPRPVMKCKRCHSEFMFHMLKDNMVYAKTLQDCARRSLVSDAR